MNRSREVVVAVTMLIAILLVVGAASLLDPSGEVIGTLAVAGEPVDGDAASGRSITLERGALASGVRNPSSSADVWRIDDAPRLSIGGEPTGPTSDLHVARPALLSDSDRSDSMKIGGPPGVGEGMAGNHHAWSRSASPAPTWRAISNMSPVLSGFPKLQSSVRASD